MRPLRVCRVCGFKTHTEEDLALFEKDSRYRYGRRNHCKKCSSKRMSERLSRTAELAEIFRSRSPDGLIRCHFCGEEVIRLEGSLKNSIAIHSLDENHENWDHANKVPAHKGCHQIHHHLGAKYKKHMKVMV